MNEPKAAVGHMPFPGHRTQKEVREAEEKREQTRRMIERHHVGSL